MDRDKARQWGSDIIRTRISRAPFIEEKRTWKDFKFFEWAFIVCSLVSILTSIGFSIYQLVVILTGDNKYYIFPVLVILNNIFSGFFLWHGVREEMPFRLLVQLVIKAIIWVFDLIYFITLFVKEEPKDPGPPVDDDDENEIWKIRFYVSSALIFLTITSGGFVIYQYWTSNIATFRAVGTEPKYVRLYRLWTFAHNMVLLDAVVFLLVVFHIFNFPYFANSHAVYYVPPIWLVVTAAYMFLGIAAVDRESRMLTFVFYAASHLQPIFLIFMLVKARKTELGLLLFISLYTTAVFNLVTHIGVLIAVVRCQNSYGLGLKQAAAKEVERKQLLTTTGNDGNAHRNKLQLRLNLDETPPSPTETEL